MQKIQFRCKTCGEEGWIQCISDGKTVEDIQDYLRKKDGFQCHVGNHVELNSADKHWVLKPETLQIDEKPLTDETWLADLQQKVGETWSNDELTAQFEVLNFTFGLCRAKRKSTGETGYLNFSHSPSGKRYYHGFSG